MNTQNKDGFGKNNLYFWIKKNKNKNKSFGVIPKNKIKEI